MRILTHKLAPCLAAILMLTQTGLVQAAENAEPAYVLLSFTRIGNQQLFSIYDQAADRSFWLAENERHPDIEIVNFDREARKLTIRHNGEEIELLQQAASTVSPAAAEQHADLTREERREQRAERREQMRALRERWEAAASESPRLQELEVEIRNTGRSMWQSIRELRDTDPEDSARQAQLRTEIERRREAMNNLVSQATEAMRNNPAFQPDDIELSQYLGRIIASPRRGGWDRPRGEARE